MGHEVCTTHDGLSAPEVEREFRPDAVLLDIGLPQMDGFEVAAELRSHPEFAGVLIVGSSGYSRESDRRRAEPKSGSTRTWSNHPTPGSSSRSSMPAGPPRGRPLPDPRRPRGDVRTSHPGEASPGLTASLVHCSSRLSSSLGVDGFDQVQVEPGLPGTPVIGLESITADADKQGRGSPPLADIRRHLVSVDRRQPDIEEDDVEAARSADFHCGGSVSHL